MSTVHIADIMASGYESFCQQYGGSAGNHKVIRAITSCRTNFLGGHQYECPDCHAQASLHNSCGNRHCPQCQTLARGDWVAARKSELLPIPYFHAVFTIPSQLNPFVLRNKKALYAILFRSVNETMQQLGATSRFLGASIGFVAVMHSWGQNLMDHPHIHCIVPAGGISQDGKRWIPCKSSFLFPFAVMRTLFRAKVLDYFKQGIVDGSIVRCGTLAEYADKAKFDALLKKLYTVNWVIFVKQPFAGPARVVEYLGNYTHRVAISESRIVSHNTSASTVSFVYKDYADDSKQKVMTLSQVEFIRRFLLHVLPTGFMRIRHYGFLSNCNRKKGLLRCAEIFASLKKKKQADKRPDSPVKQPWHLRVLERTGFNPLLCRNCGKAVMNLVGEIARATDTGRFCFESS